jgi:putative toxin-antitoxin system antitoxin component (TIGR02293 family)
MNQAKLRIMSESKLYDNYPVAKDDQNIVSEPYIAWDLETASSKISKGLGAGILATIQSRLHLSNKQLSDLILVSARTLDRRKKENRLPPDESERSYRIARLTDRAYQVLGESDKVATWFSEPNFALGNRTPLELAKTEPGAHLIEQLLGRIEHGMTV